LIAQIKGAACAAPFVFDIERQKPIPPPMPPPGGIAGPLFRQFGDHRFSGHKQTSNRARILQGRTHDLAGSMMPASTMSTLPVWASKP
jgi:hypothetical protein